MAAQAGLDAFVHAFESYLSRQANALADAQNLHAMRLILGSIRRFVATPADAGPALDMLCGSALAAMSFGVTGLGNVHCMAMAVGSVVAVPHGLAVSLCLPDAAAFNAPARPDRFRVVADLLGIDVHGIDDAETGAQVAASLQSLRRDLGLADGLRALGIDEAAVPDLARRAFAADYNRWNPRFTDEADFQDIFRAAL